MCDCANRTVLCFLTRDIRWQHPIAGFPALHFTFFSGNAVKKTDVEKQPSLWEVGDLRKKV